MMRAKQNISKKLRKFCRRILMSQAKKTEDITLQYESVNVNTYLPAGTAG